MKIGDRWRDTSDGEIIELVKISSSLHFVTVVGCRSRVVGTELEAALNIFLPSCWVYLGKSESFKNLYDKLNEDIS